MNLIPYIKSDMHINKLINILELTILTVFVSEGVPIFLKISLRVDLTPGGRDNADKLLLVLMTAVAFASLPLTAVLFSVLCLFLARVLRMY